MRTEDPRSIPFDAVSYYPRPRTGIVDAGLTRFPYSNHPDLLKYNDHSAIVRRFIIGPDYQGPQLPKGTSEILEVWIQKVGQGTAAEQQIIRYVFTVYSLAGIWDRFLEHAEDGMSAYFEPSGNVGRIVIDGDNLVELAAEGEKDTVALPRNRFLARPYFMDFKVEEHPREEAIDLKELLGIQ